MSSFLHSAWKLELCPAGAEEQWVLGGLLAASPTPHPAPKLSVRRGEEAEGAAGARMCKPSPRLQD